MKEIFCSLICSHNTIDVLIELMKSNTLTGQILQIKEKYIENVFLHAQNLYSVGYIIFFPSTVSYKVANMITKTAIVQNPLNMKTRNGK